MSDLSLSWEERYAPRRDLAKKYPNDWPLQFALQQPILQHSEMGHEYDLALSHYRSLPDPVLGELLEARLLSSLHRKKSRESLNHVLSQAADSPWSHLATLEWAADRRNGDPDPALADREFDEFRQRCPGNLQVFQYLGSGRDSQKFRSHVAALRNAIETEKKRGTDGELLGLAWRWERVTYGENRLEEFRRAVRADVDFLRAHPNYDSWPWVFMVSYGYEEILKDKTAEIAIEDETLLRAANGQAAWWIEQERWKEQNPPPQLSAWKQPIPPREMAYSERRAAFMLKLIERFWGKPYAAIEAANLMNAKGLPAGAFERLADFVLSNAERFPDQSTSVPPVQFQVAEAYLDHKIRLDGIPALVQQGLEQAENQGKYDRDSDAFDKVSRPDGVDANAALTDRLAREILIRHAIVTHQRERALALLGDFRRELDQSKPADTTGPAGTSWRSNQNSYSRLARQAGLDVPMDDLRVPDPEEPEPYPVADFEAKDLSGRVWRLANLKGKVTYINIWATWCETCLVEMAGLQKLYEQWTDRSDRLVLTISIDSNPRLAEAFIKENHYSFPVISSQEIAEKFSPVHFPQNCLIDPQGQRLKMPPPPAFDRNIPRIDEMVDQIFLRQ